MRTRGLSALGKMIKFPWLSLMLLIQPCCNAQNPPSQIPVGRSNSFWDLQQYGGYISDDSAVVGVCSTVASSFKASCSKIADFAVGQGIAIFEAGAKPVARPPGAPTAVSTLNVSRNVATITASSAISFTVGSVVLLGGSADPTLNGHFPVQDEVGYNTFRISINHKDCSPCEIGTEATVTALVSSSVTAQGIISGTTAYNYKVSTVSFNGGISASSGAYSTSKGPAVLGVNKISIRSYSRKGGITTFVCGTPDCNIEAGAEVNIAYVSGQRDPSIECACTVYTAAANTFTILQVGRADQSSTEINDNAQIVAKVLVRWVMQPGVVMRSLVWRCVGSLTTTCASDSSYRLAGIAQGMDSSFTDWGFDTKGVRLPSYYPGKPLSRPINGILSTTIKNVSGNTLLLSSPAQASTTDGPALHDNAPNILSICNVAITGGFGGTVYLSPRNVRGGRYLINSPLLLTSCPPYTKIAIGVQLLLNEPIVERSGGEIEGFGEGSGNNIPSFVTDHTAFISGTAYPLILIGPSSLGGTLSNLNVVSAQPYQSAIFFDQDNLGNNATQWLFRNVYVQGQAPSQPFKLAGGFGFIWERGSINVYGSSGWGYPPALWDVIDQGIGANSQQLAGIISFDKTYIAGSEILFDAANQYPVFGAGHITINELLNESSLYPSIRFNTGENSITAIDIIKPSYSDPLAGVVTPLIDITNALVISGLRVVTPFCNHGPLFAGLNQGGIEVWNGAGGCSPIGVESYIAHDQQGQPLVDVYANASVQLTGTGQIYYAMETPKAPTVEIVGAQGPNAGTYYYSILAHDINGNTTAVSPASDGIAVNGSQGVKVSWIPVPGQVTSTICRGSSRAGILCMAVGNGFHVPGDSYIDGPTVYPSASLPSVATAGASSLSRSGVATPMIRTSFMGQLAPNQLAGISSCKDSAESIIFQHNYVTQPVILAFDETTKAGLNITSKSTKGFTVSCSGPSDVFDWLAIGNPN